MEPPGLATLPAESLEPFLARLDTPRAIANASQVCKRWHQIMTGPRFARLLTEELGCRQWFVPTSWQQVVRQLWLAPSLDWSRMGKCIDLTAQIDTQVLRHIQPDRTIFRSNTTIEAFAMTPSGPCPVLRYGKWRFPLSGIADSVSIRNLSRKRCLTSPVGIFNRGQYGQWESDWIPKLPLNLSKNTVISNKGTGSVWYCSTADHGLCKYTSGGTRVVHHQGWPQEPIRQLVFFGQCSSGKIEGFSNRGSYTPSTYHHVDFTYWERDLACIRGTLLQRLKGQPPFKDQAETLKTLKANPLKIVYDCAPYRLLSTETLVGFVDPTSNELKARLSITDAGRLLESASSFHLTYYDRTIRIIKRATGACVGRVVIPRRVTPLHIEIAGPFVLAATDQAVHILDKELKEEKATFTCDSSEGSPRILQHEEYIVFATEQNVRVIDPYSLSQVAKLALPSQAALCVNTNLCLVSTRKSAICYRLPHLIPLLTLPAEGTRFKLFHHNLVASTPNGPIQLWEPARRRLLATIPLTSQPELYTLFDRWLITVHNDHIALWLPRAQKKASTAPITCQPVTKLFILYRPRGICDTLPNRVALVTHPPQTYLFPLEIPSEARDASSRRGETDCERPSQRRRLG